MTDRSQRFLRLTSLRKQQHDVSVAVLQSARHRLHATMREAEEHEAQLRCALLEQRTALVASDHESWLLSCAAFEFKTLHLMQRRVQCNALSAAVTVAESAEREARRHMRQTERLLESIRKEESAAVSLKEQKALDEAAQLLRIRSLRLGNRLSAFS